jgi:hypothetical protein
MLGKRPDHDAYIQPGAGMADVKNVPLVAFTDGAFILRGPMVPLYLRHTRNTGLYKVPELIVWNEPGKLPAVGMHMWPGAYNAHIAQQYIKELGQFVDVGIPEEFAQSGDPHIVFRGLPVMGLLIHDHGAELIAGEGPASPAYSFL